MPKMLYQGHGSFRLTCDDGRVIYADPCVGEGHDLPTDVILVTHQHGDHNKIQRCVQKQIGALSVARFGNVITAVFPATGAGGNIGGNGGGIGGDGGQSPDDGETAIEDDDPPLEEWHDLVWGNLVLASLPVDTNIRNGIAAFDVEDGVTKFVSFSYKIEGRVWFFGNPLFIQTKAESYLCQLV